MRSDGDASGAGSADIRTTTTTTAYNTAQHFLDTCSARALEPIYQAHTLPHSEMAEDNSIRNGQ